MILRIFPSSLPAVVRVTLSAAFLRKRSQLRTSYAARGRSLGQKPLVFRFLRGPAGRNPVRILGQLSSGLVLSRQETRCGSARLARIYISIIPLERCGSIQTLEAQRCSIYLCAGDRPSPSTVDSPDRLTQAIYHKNFIEQ